MVIESLYQPLWQRFSTQVSQDRLGQSVLLLGEQSLSMQKLLQEMVCFAACTAANKDAVCTDCQSCRLARSGKHPDIHNLQPDRAGGLIKVEQVRDLQEWVYRSPRLSAKRIIIVNPADKMNKSAANGLLKILEEPPEFILFFLIAGQTDSVLPTILSRCQRWHLPLPLSERMVFTNKESKLAETVDILLNEFIALCRGVLHPLELAEKWSKHGLDEVVDFLYRLTAFLIASKLCPQMLETADSRNLAERCLLSPLLLYKQLDTLNQLRGYLNQGIAVNQQVSLEALLLNYV